jgi:arylsulfatase A-like enzyme
MRVWVITVAFVLGLIVGAHGAKPNIILILADDLGYETIGANGGTSYRTPALDKLAATGARFTHCFAQPLCTPSRVQLMTGLYNVRNYTRFGQMDPKAVTFAHLLKGAGYATCMAGKWQLGQDVDLPKKFGFDEYYLWQHTRRPPRYANPGLELNGVATNFANGEYGPDVISDYALDFVTRNKNRPFFLYYSMLLTHAPYQPTPDSKTWDPKAKGEAVNITKENFGDMVAYMDKLVGKLTAKLDALGLRENTLILFLGDNGTGKGTRSTIDGREVIGGKGTTTAAGMHVPLIANWPGAVVAGTVCSDLVDTTDFLPTLLDVAGARSPADLKLDGRSFFPQLRGQRGRPREWIYSWYSPRQGNDRTMREFAFDHRYKLYRSGEFFDLARDVKEQRPLKVGALEGEAAAAAKALQEALDQYKNARPAALEESIEGQAQAHRGPNVVVIVADDQGWGDLSVNGNSNLATPNIDSLARTGVILDRFYVSPVCSPTRAEFFTGRYHPRGGVRGVSTGGERLDLSEKTIADTFKAAGYATGAFGKWHNGTQWPYHPKARGFDEYYGFTSGHWGEYFDPPLDHNGKQVRGKGYTVDDFTDHALDFMTKNKDRPFFCYVPYNTPHSPMQVPDRFYKKFAKADLKQRARETRQEDLEFTRAALAMCENIDWNVGRILKQLDELKLADNTIVIYFSDNGPNSARWNGGMKGRKGSTDEGGIRSPFLIRWPGQIQAGKRVTEIAAAIDLLPTLADFAGIRIVSTQALDGVSLKPLLIGTAKDWPDRMIFSHWGGKVSVRTQRYRLDAAGKLFDMEADPGQERDMAKDEPQVATRMSKVVREWSQELLPGLKTDDRPFTVGYPEFPLTQLPARDGVPHGGVKRSAGAPNCSFFQNWTSPDDRITWDIAVATAGKYEAVVYYTCPPSDAGSVVELNCSSSRIEAVVSEAHDPPLRGAEHDRVPRRGESYVKDFTPLRLGVMELKSGRGELTLRALKVPGKQVMDVRALHLTLLKSD